jgi:DNA (cytosine-5)-methyltransferase 1
LNELELFAGAGGGILAAQLLGHRTVCAVESNPYRIRRLMQRQNEGHLPPFPIWDDVRTFDGHPWRGIVDCVSGGFPCQAYSSAARGKNVADDLWPEMRRIVADVAPRYVRAENVERRAIDRAAEDLEAMGYQTRALTLSAADLGADHVRERHWLFAYTDSDSELRGSINAEMGGLSRVRSNIWAAYPGESRMADGLANRMDRLQATGDGQVPIVAAAAFTILSS